MGTGRQCPARQLPKSLNTSFPAIIFLAMTQFGWLTPLPVQGTASAFRLMSESRLLLSARAPGAFAKPSHRMNHLVFLSLLLVTGALLGVSHGWPSKFNSNGVCAAQPTSGAKRHGNPYNEQ